MRRYINFLAKGSCLIFAYFIGQTIGRIFFPNVNYNSRHFKSFRSPGWIWICNGIVHQKIIGYNRFVPWPVSSRIIVVGSQNIKFDWDDLNNFQTVGNYFQAFGKISIGKGCYIAPNVGLITQNHNLQDLDERIEAQSIILGKSCWLGMNSMILPGVHLGDHTVVGAGSIVTKSFPLGHCVIAGNPARIIKEI